MIKQIIEATGTRQQKKQVYKKVLAQTCMKPKQVQEEIKSYGNLDELAEKLAAISFSLTNDLLLSAFSIEACFAYLNKHNQHSPQLTSFFRKVLQQKSQYKFMKLAGVLDRMPTIEKALVILSGYAQFCTKDNEEQQLPRILPMFIRMSSFIIGKYLNLKNQPAIDNSDRIENDKVIIQSCEKWVAQSMLTFFQNLPQPQDHTIRHMSLLCIGDIMGALLQSLRENNLQKQILQNLLQNATMKYLSAVYPYEQIYDIYIGHLKSTNFTNPVEKIEIPEVYNRKFQLNTQAFAYMTLKFLESSIYSLRNQLKFLVAATSQSLIRPYEIKLPLIQKLQIVLEKLGKVKLESGDELNYPASLLFFNFYYHQNQHYQRIKSHFQFGNKKIETHSLLNLKFIGETGLVPQINDFLFKWLNQQKIDQENAILIMKQIGCDGPINKKNYKIVEEICGRLPQKYLKTLIDQFEEAGAVDKQTIKNMRSKQ